MHWVINSDAHQHCAAELQAAEDTQVAHAYCNKSQLSYYEDASRVPFSNRRYYFLVMMRVQNEDVILSVATGLFIFDSIGRARFDILVVYRRLSAQLQYKSLHKIHGGRERLGIRVRGFDGSCLRGEGNTRAFERPTAHK